MSDNKITNTNIKSINHFEKISVKMSSKCCSCNPDFKPAIGYYWRNFNGNIPEDAVEGGCRNGETTYIGIGQALHDPAGLLTATIYRGNSIITVPYLGKAHSSLAAPKILCSNEKNCFVWENVTNNNFSTATIGKHLVVGGYEKGNKLYIGRAMYQGETVVGKVVAWVPNDERLYFVHGGEELFVHSFQVLTYVSSL